MIVYISIGNSDDQLTQADWAAFCIEVRSEARALGHVHGSWYSPPDSPWQNACWCLELAGHGDAGTSETLAELRTVLSRIARRYRQESIALARVAETEFVS